MSRLLAFEALFLLTALVLPASAVPIGAVGLMLAGFFAEQAGWDRDDHRRIARQVAAVHTVLIAILWTVTVPLEGDLAEASLATRGGLALLLGGGGGLAAGGLALIGLDARRHQRLMEAGDP